MVAQGLTPPRVGTPRSKAKTLGPVAKSVATELGVDWWPWQRYVADTSLEFRARRNRDLPRFDAGMVGILVPRQCGKSVWARVRAWMQCLLPELDEVPEIVGAPVGPQHVGWLCQDRANAIRAWLEAVDALMDSPYRSTVKRVKMQRGEESVAFRNGSWLRVVTPSRTGPRGLDLDLIVLDEALAHPVELLAALAPTQAARDQAVRSLGAQLVALSSEGDDRSTLLATLTEIGRRSVAEKDRTRAWFEWSAPSDADVYDPEVWRAAIPTLDRPGGISTEFVRMQAETMDIEDFRREFLCLHTPRPAQQVVDLEAWQRAPVGVPGMGGVVFAVDATPSGSAAALVAVGMGERGMAVEIVDAKPGVEWLTMATIERALRWGAPVALDTYGPVAWMVPALEQAEVEVIKIGGGENLAAAAKFSTMVEEGAIAHQPDIRFDSAVQLATRRRSGDRWAFDRHAGDLSVLVAAALGVWALETNDVAQVQVW